MKQNAAPWIITLLALLAAVFPALKASGPPPALPPQETAPKTAEKTTPPPSGAPQANAGAGQDARWKNLLLPFRELLESKPPPASARAGDLSIVPRDAAPCSGCEYKIVQKAAGDSEEPVTVSEIADAAQGFEIDFLIALVPDPIDSSLDLRFDQGIEGIQTALVDQGYLPDRFWFPWKTDAGQQELSRRMPGIWLFTQTQPRPRIKAVLLVGETPKIGVQKAALREAIEFTLAFPLEAGPIAPVRILGPSFSGSAYSLKKVLDESGLEPYRGAGSDAATIRSSYRIVTGSATAKGLEDILGDRPAFQRTVAPDDALQKQAFEFLQKSMGWNLDKAALLIESDTSYGQSGGAVEVDRKGNRDPEIIFFPSGLANIRTEWEKSNTQKSDTGPVTVPRSTLSLDLRGFRRPVDLVPEFSSVSPQSKDLVIANLLTAISRGGIRYVGILATDTRDKLFLAERIQKFAPDVVLFTFDNNLLYAHPEYSSALDGTLVLSSFPLFTANQDWKDFFGGPKGPFRRQFASEFQQGIFQATFAFLQGKLETQPRIWISTVGNGSLWPLADFSLDGSSDREDLNVEGVSGRTQLQLWLFGLVILLLGGWLWHTAHPLFQDLSPSRPGTSMPSRRKARAVFRKYKPPVVLLSLGLGALWISASVLLILGTIPFIKDPTGWWARTGLLTLLGLLYVVAMLMAMPARRSQGTEPVFRKLKPSRKKGRRSKARRWKEALNRPARLREVVLVLLLWTAIVALPQVLYWLWIPERPEFFYFRARRFSSGLSPVLSLLLWSAAVFAWAHFEIHRRLVYMRRFTAWPYPSGRHPTLKGCQALACSCLGHLKGRLPSRRFWITFFILAIPPSVFLMTTIQPITEPRHYGWVFTALMLFVLTLCAMSFFRFVALWLALADVLKRLNQTRLIGAFRRVSPQVGWNPLKSFGWQMPTFNLMVLQAEKVKSLSTPDHRSEIDSELEKLFEAERKKDMGAELEARRKLHRHFARAGRLLAGSKSDPVEDFLAIRLVAYIRHVFLHLHYCLNQSLAAALLALLAIRLYAFEPKQFFSMCVWVFIIPAVFVTLWIFLEMDRDASLSAIGGTDPGKVTFNRVFFTNFFSYGLIPLFGILVSLFPEASRWLASLVNPLLRVTGVG